MAKKFNEIYVEAKRDIYKRSNKNLITLIAKANNLVKSNLLTLAPNGNASTSKYNLQIRVLPTVFKHGGTAEVTDVSKLSDRTASFANNTPLTGSVGEALSFIDKFDTVDWESYEIITGQLQGIGFKSAFNDQYDMDNMDKHSDDIYLMTETRAEYRKSFFLGELAKTTNTTTASIPNKWVKQDALTWLGLSAAVTEVAKGAVKAGSPTVKHMHQPDRNDFYIIASLDVADRLAAEKGATFHQERPVFNTGVSSENVNGIPFIAEPTLPDNTAYIVHKYAFYFKQDGVSKDIMVDLGITQYKGKAFYEIYKTLFPNLISKVAVVTPTLNDEVPTDSVIDATANLDASDTPDDVTNAPAEKAKAKVTTKSK